MIADLTQPSASSTVCSELFGSLGMDRRQPLGNAFSSLLEQYLQGDLGRAISWNHSTENDLLKRPVMEVNLDSFGYSQDVTGQNNQSFVQVSSLYPESGSEPEPALWSNKTTPTSASTNHDPYLSGLLGPAAMDMDFQASIATFID